MNKEQIEQVLSAHSKKVEPIYKKIGQVLEGLHMRVSLLETLFYDQTKKELKKDE